MIGRARIDCGAAIWRNKMFKKFSTTTRRLTLCAALFGPVWITAGGAAQAQVAAAPAQSQSQQDQQNLSEAQIEQLVAPIALYPDPLLTQILMASTYPLEVVEAARWSRDNPDTKGQWLENAMQGEPWDPSVKSLTAVPQTLKMMNDKLDWTQQLGDAFLAQQQDVLDAVQKLRAEAKGAGNLQSTPQQVVTTASPPADSIVAGTTQPIVIQPVNPEIYYVPVYNPAVTYGTWDYPAYQPFYWSPPGFVASNVVSFAAGVAVGAAIWGNCDWWHHNVIINVNNYNVFNRTNINVTNNVWTHNPAHRGNVPYGNRALAERFGRGNEVTARDAFRDRLDSGRNDLFRDRPGDQSNQRPADRADTRPPQDRNDSQRFEAPRDPERRVGDDRSSGTPDRRDADLERTGGDRNVDRPGFPRRNEGEMVRPERTPSFHPERRTDGGFREREGVRWR
jgi:hypothetical protein